MTNICVSKLTIIGSYNGLSPDRRQAIISTNDGILLIDLLGTNLSEILIEIHAFLFKKIHLKMSSWKWRPFCLGLNVLLCVDMWLLMSKTDNGMFLASHTRDIRIYNENMHMVNRACVFFG